MKTLSRAVLLGLVAVAAVPATAQARLEIGLQDDDVFVNHRYFDLERAYRLAHELRVTTLRLNVTWSTVAGASPHRPYDFGAYDAAVQQAAEHGMRVQLDLVGPAPRWASRRHKVSNYKPSARSYARFAAAAARHFKGRVRRYSIWNEPNHKGWLAPMSNAASQYRRLYAGGYRAIKRADRRAQVLIGELAPIGRRGQSTSPLKFLRALTCSRRNWRARRRCPRLRADGFAHHPYTVDFRPQYAGLSVDDVTTGSLVRLTTALHRLAHRRALTTPHGGELRIYLTEYGFLARGKRAFPPTQRAAYLRKGFALAARNRRVKQMIHYMLVEGPHISAWDSSLVDRDGTLTPSFGALRTFVATL